MPSYQEFNAAAYGGGRNGANLIAMYEHGIMPKVITFANTGRLDHTHGEKPETYRHVEIMSRWCEDHFGIPITEVHKNSKYASLYDNCIEKNMLPSVCYGLRSCSDKWKIQPQDSWFNRYAPARDWWLTCHFCASTRSAHVKLDTGKRSEKGRRIYEHWCPTDPKLRLFSGEKITKFIGYDAGEERRATIAEDAKYVYRYLLIEIGWYLEDCIEAHKRHGLPVPIKSACSFCGASTKEQVIWLSENHPEIFAEAVAMEDNALKNGNLIKIKGLGRHWSWRELVESQPSKREAMPEPPQMHCVCFDGED